jgi:zinc transport system substrate-binding protein
MNILRKVIFTLLLLSALTGVYAGGKKDSAPVGEKMVIAVSILPQQYFLERIGGNRVKAIVLVGAGQDPHSYEPTPSQLATLSVAKAWILSGVDFEEGFAPTVARQFPKLKIVDGTEGVKFRQLQDYEKELGEDDEAADSEHHHETNIDRHTWLGHEPALILAGHIRDTLLAVDPAGKTVYDANYDSLVKDIDAVFADLKTSLAPLAGKSVMVFHPAFGYFLDEFTMKQISVETGGKEPTAKALTELIARAKADKVPAIFVQAQFPVAAAKTVATEAGAEVVMLNPLDPDWLANVKRIGEALKKAYK